MLSELGKNVPKEYLKNWKKNELVYYFNSEEKMYQEQKNNYNNIDKNLNVSKIIPFSYRGERLLNLNNINEIKNEKLDNNSIFKFLTLFYIHPDIKNNNLDKNGYCHSFRKSDYHNNISYIHPNDSFEIKRNHTQINYIEYFNKYKYFISYDPLTFLSIISILCGCISIVYPIENVSKLNWYKKTAVYEYMKSNNITQLYGIINNTNQSTYNLIFQISGSTFPPFALTSGQTATIITDNGVIFVITQSASANTIYAAQDGTAASPAFTFGSDLTTGMYRGSSVGILGLSANGQSMMLLNGTNTGSLQISTLAQFTAGLISGGTF
jgi:hypothetical protein